MHSFRDSRGQDWLLEITVSSVRRVRALAALDLLGLVKDGFAPLGELVSDPVRLADILWALVQPQAAACGVSDEDFGRGLAGDALAEAAEAFVEELVDFFPDAKARQSLKKALAKGRQAAALVQERAAREVDQLDPAALARTYTDSSGTSRASSALTPARSPSPSS